jgi:hypothetical protein
LSTISQDHSLVSHSRLVWALELLDDGVNLCIRVRRFPVDDLLSQSFGEVVYVYKLVIVFPQPSEGILITVHVVCLTVLP